MGLLQIINIWSLCSTYVHQSLLLCQSDSRKRSVQLLAWNQLIQTPFQLNRRQGFRGQFVITRSKRCSMWMSIVDRSLYNRVHQAVFLFQTASRRRTAQLLAWNHLIQNPSYSIVYRRELMQLCNMYYRNPSWIKNGTSAHAPLPWLARIRSVSFSSHWVSLPPRKRRRFLLHKETQLPLATWKFRMLRWRLWWLPPRVTCTMDTLIQQALMNAASTHLFSPFSTALSMCVYA